MKDVIPELKNLLYRERKTEKEKRELYGDLFHVPRFGQVVPDWRYGKLVKI